MLCAVCIYAMQAAAAAATAVVYRLEIATKRKLKNQIRYVTSSAMCTRCVSSTMHKQHTELNSCRIYAASIAHATSCTVTFECTTIGTIRIQLISKGFPIQIKRTSNTVPLCCGSTYGMPYGTVRRTMRYRLESAAFALCMRSTRYQNMYTE